MYNAIHNLTKGLNIVTSSQQCVINLNPLDPNPTVAAHAVFPKLKPMKFPLKCKRNVFVLIKWVCVGKTLNMVICSKFWGNLEGIWGIPGEILHTGWKIPGVYRVKIIHNIYVCA